MPATAEKCVKTCIQKVKDTFEGFDEAVVEEFYNIMIDEVRNFGNEVRREAMASAARGAAEPDKPRLKRVNNYTLFGNDFRANNPDIKEDMFKKIAAAWKELSDDEKAEWKSKADEVNAEAREKYVKEYGEPPKKQKKKVKAKRTNPFQEYVSEFRTKHPKVGHKDVFREASKLWKKLSEKQRKKYTDQAATLNEEYKAAHEQYLKDHPEAALELAASGKQKREKKLAPKKRSGYLLFGADWRANDNTDDLKGKEAMSALAAAWGKCSEKEKKKYRDRSTKENVKIVADFVKQNPECEWTRKHQAETTA